MKTSKVKNKHIIRLDCNLNVSNIGYIVLTVCWWPMYVTI